MGLKTNQALEFITNNPRQTKKLAELLAQKILKSPSKEKALVIGLIGELGSGKTTFLQGFARALKVREKVLSPSFIIMRKSKIELPDSTYANFYHIDCYRIKNKKEILDLNFKKIISNPKNIVAIEWAEKVKKIIPKDAIILKFRFISKTKRKITQVHPSKQ